MAPVVSEQNETTGAAGTIRTECAVFGIRRAMSDQPPGGEIRLLRTNDGVVIVDHADAIVWFAQHTLDDLKERPDPGGGWTFDGEFVTLDVANGRWIWKLTGRMWSHHYGPGTTPLVMAEGVWPD